MARHILEPLFSPAIFLVLGLAVASCAKVLDPEKEIQTGDGHHSAWMATLADGTRLEELSIPGAHDAASATITTLTHWTRTQALDIPELWNAGVRAFDLRPALVNGTMGIYHDKYSANLTFPQILSTLSLALERYPDEFAILLIRHEREADGDAEGWSKAMNDCLEGQKQKLAAYHPGLTVGELRGKILILSRNRFEGGPCGAYIEGWYSGTDLSRQQGASLEDVSGEKHPLWLQDYYDPSGIQAKWEAVRGLWDAREPSGTEIPPLKINHCSGYVGKLPDYVKNAAGINGKAAEYIRGADAPAGIVMMDFAGASVYRRTSVYGEELVEALIQANSN